MLSFIEPESLLVEIPVKMRRIYTDVGSLEGPFQEAPEILDIVSVNVATNKLDRVINHLMRVGVGKAQIGFESISVEMRASLDGSANLRCQCFAADIGDMHGLDATWSLIAGAFDDAENSFFARTAGASDFPLFDMPMHVLGETANKRFVGFDLAAHFQERAGLHCQSDPVIHEPCSFLGDAKSAVHLVAANPVLAVGDHPDCSEPFPQVDRAIFEDGPDLGRELAPLMLFFTLPEPPRNNKARISATACRAANAVRPTQFDHRAKRDVRVGEIPDCFDEGLGFVRHTDQYDTDRLLRQVYYYPSLGTSRA